jgi:hypothetical protein
MSDPFDRVLRAAARRARAVGVCPHPEMLASYLDNGLTSDERASLEAHAADCVRCQQHLSLLGAVSVDRPDPDVEESRPWLVRWGWLVPVATAVLVVAVWTRTPAPVDAPAQFPQREVAPAIVPPEAPAAAEGAGSQADNMGGPGRDARAVPAPKAKAEADRERQDFAAQARPQVTVPAAPAAVPAPPPPAVARDQVGQLADSVRAPAEAKEAAAGAAPMREEARLMRKAAAPSMEAAVSDRERYRAAGGRIERSQDGGASWHELFTDPALTFTALACGPEGACWFGTSTGVVLRTSQAGLLRSRLPESAPVTAISAASATDAVVTIGSRRYRTSDGSSWTPLP